MSAEEQLLLMAEEIVSQLGSEAALLLSAAITTYIAGKEPMVQEQKTPEYARRNRKLIKK